jgi:hypothetical protein
MSGRSPRGRFVPRLWTLVLVAVLLGVSALYLTVWRPYSERVAILTDFNGTRAWASDVEKRGPDWLRTATTRRWLHGVDEEVSIGLLDDVHGLALSFSGADDPYLRRLHVFRQLTELHIDHAHVTDAGLQHLVRHQSLEVLNLSHNRIYGTGFEALRALPHLKSLDLAYTPIHDRQLEVLTTFPELKRVGVHACRHLSPAFVDRVVAERPGWLDGLETLQWSWEDEAQKRAAGDDGGRKQLVTTPAPVVELAQ